MLINSENVEKVLRSVIHPESGNDIVSLSMVGSINASAHALSLTLTFTKSRDPFATSIKRAVVETLASAFPELGDNITVIIKEAPQQNHPQPKSETKSTTTHIKKIIAVASGKGGVGKSTVTANLAVTLARMGYKVGILDADIYGPSQPKMFGAEGYMPATENVDGTDLIIPVEAFGVKVISIGFFISPNDALIWRGPMATNALRQLIHQCRWGALDFLLIDLPPGTGDVHLTILQELKIDGAIIVSTPQQVAVADVLRGVNMFRADKINIPILGIVENMAWFTPAELPDNRYFLFGCGGAAALAAKEGLELLGEIPIIQSVMEGADHGTPASVASSPVSGFYQQIAEKVVSKLQ